jgi:hypothetical protein
MNLALPTQFQSQSVQEPDAFLHLFPQHFDFIYAEHLDSVDRHDWKIESHSPLSAYLYGVRFGKQTDYLSSTLTGVVSTIPTAIVSPFTACWQR